MSLHTLMVFFVLGSVVWVGIDASGRDFSDSGFASKTWHWVAGCLLFWIVVFPIYLAKRRNAPARA